MARPKEFKVDDALRKGIEAFCEKGFEATSMTDLTEKMGIHRASLYDTFGDKRALFLAALGQYQLDLAERLKTQLEMDGSPVEAIRHLLESALNRCTQAKNCLCVKTQIEMAPGDEEIKTLLTEHHDRLLKLLACTISRGQARGEFRLDISPIQAAEYIQISYLGLGINALASDDQTASKTAIDLVLETLTRV